jgi:PIN domain-containing protein
MYYMMLDTCVLLDIATRKNDILIVSALETLTRSGNMKLILPDLVTDEFNKNKNAVANKTRKRLSQEFKQVKNAVEEFGGEQKAQTIDALNEIDSRLPLLSEINYATISRVEELIADAIQIEASDSVKIIAVQRGIDKKAPFHKSKNSMADAVIIEQFAEFVSNNYSNNDFFIFISHNVNDFSSSDQRKPHEDFCNIFHQNNVLYFNNTPAAIKIIDEEILADIQFEHDYTEETRGLREMLDAMDELFDKVWYNRHCNLRYRIDNGEVRIVPSHSKEHGDDIIHKSIWKVAQKEAQHVREKYDDTGPWDDFEWGMLNGKLSALRWVLGFEWDMLDT